MVPRMMQTISLPFAVDLGARSLTVVGLDAVDAVHVAASRLSHLSIEIILGFSLSAQQPILDHAKK
jgi:hypothetical protein